MPVNDRIKYTCLRNPSGCHQNHKRNPLGFSHGLSFGMESLQRKQSFRFATVVLLRLSWLRAERSFGTGFIQSRFINPKK